MWLPSKLSIFGLILLLIGVICLAIGEISLRNENAVELGRMDSVWYYAANLTRGNTYGVDVSAGDGWSTPFGSGDFTRAMPVNVTITSPGGGVTSLQAFYWGEPSTSPYYRVGTPAAIVAVVYRNVDTVGLSVDSNSPHIRFMAKQDGLFNVTVLRDGLWSQEPPDYILFSEEVIPNREAYSLLAAVGGIVCAFGGVTCIISLFKSQNSKRRSRK